MNHLIKLLLQIRAMYNRTFFPAKLPFSRKFGFDRGTPIDRFWIEQYLQANTKNIVGRCLEITDSSYTKKYGHAVTSIDVLDLNPNNKSATIIADLRQMPQVKSHTYDTIILTQVLGMINDYQAVISECYRILKSKGCLLVTTSCLSPTHDPKCSFWRLTPEGLRYALSKRFKKITISSFGNAEAGAAFWLGLAQEDIDNKYLFLNDPSFPCLSAAIAYK